MKQNDRDAFLWCAKAAEAEFSSSFGDGSASKVVDDGAGAAGGVE